MGRLLFLVPVLAIVLLPVYYLFLQGPPPLPDLDYNEWWGPESGKQKQDTSVRPFKISFGENLVKDLKDRLKRTRPLTPPLEGVGFEYGFNTNEINSWLKYWAEGYNFKERETFLNQFPQFKTNIQGLDIHFIKVTPKVPAGVQVVPMLLLHGWPGSVREFYESIPLLTAVSKDRDFALEVIVPSLPGYGFSDGAVRPGMGAPHIGIVMRNLMNRLGYKRYYVQGGDWGSVIGTSLATFFPEEVLGYHANIGLVLSTKAMVWQAIGSLWPSLIMDDLSLVDRIYPLSKTLSFQVRESGYLHIQASKPDTVGVALTDSPAGLLAYIVEKFSIWTRPELTSKPNGGLDFRFSKDQLIDNLMMYWTSKSITTSVRLYAESFNIKVLGYQLDDIPTPVPSWFIQGKYEIAYQPPFVLKLKYPNIVGVTVLDDGGHFFAFELPEVFSKDVLKAVTAFRKLQKNNEKTDL
ncbi:juvenile hormone epoxide hydrolase-like [Trichoplusia ni]|uniref:Epoxide hydrolase n=1 Tax=Trichoplusia ni TaxID=7111 RepID=A0A7E5WE28_TRINI|nr:juvenile hormone epoxide hydrolase-like [Trichoplusia ni]